MEFSIPCRNKEALPLQYFVVMIDYGRRGREAIVDPEITRREVISRVVSGEYKNISFIHEIADSSVDDITAEILAEAALPEVQMTGADVRPSISITRMIFASMRRCDRARLFGQRRRFSCRLIRGDQQNALTR
jgi:hypothetical protein